MDPYDQDFDRYPYDQDFDRYQERRAEMYVEPEEGIRILRDLIAARGQVTDQDWVKWEADLHEAEAYGYITEWEGKG